MTRIYKTRRGQLYRVHVIPHNGNQALIERSVDAGETWHTAINLGDEIGNVAYANGQLAAEVLDRIAVEKGWTLIDNKIEPSTAATAGGSRGENDDNGSRL